MIIKNKTKIAFLGLVLALSGQKMFAMQGSKQFQVTTKFLNAHSSNVVHIQSELARDLGLTQEELQTSLLAETAQTVSTTQAPQRDAYESKNDAFNVCTECNGQKSRTSMSTLTCHDVCRKCSESSLGDCPICHRQLRQDAKPEGKRSTAKLVIDGKAVTSADIEAQQKALSALQNQRGPKVGQVVKVDSTAPVQAVSKIQPKPALAEVAHPESVWREVQHRPAPAEVAHPESVWREVQHRPAPVFIGVQPSALCEVQSPIVRPSIQSASISGIHSQSVHQVVSTGLSSQMAANFSQSQQEIPSSFLESNGSAVKYGAGALGMVAGLYALYANKDGLKKQVQKLANLLPGYRA